MLSYPKHTARIPQNRLLLCHQNNTKLWRRNQIKASTRSYCNHNSQKNQLHDPQLRHSSLNLRDHFGCQTHQHRRLSITSPAHLSNGASSSTSIVDDSQYHLDKITAASNDTQQISNPDLDPNMSFPRLIESLTEDELLMLGERFFASKIF